MDVAPPIGIERALLARKAVHLEYFTVVWNCLEAFVAVAAGLISGSIALVGFGLDSCIEVTSGLAVLWRMKNDDDEDRRERLEHITLRIVGTCFLALAAYVAYESASSLMDRRVPKTSTAGIILAAASLLVMPLLSRAKRKVASRLSSAAMSADATQTQFCAYLSAILLGGLLMNALAGIWWADPVAALVMVPIMANEGIDGVRGRTCCAGDSVH